MAGKLWYIGCTHFGHANVIDYCDRPFRDVREMDAVMRGNWKRMVAPNDLVIHVGDIGWGQPEEVTEIMNALPGRKLLVAGNHDKAERLEKLGAFIKVYPTALQLEDGTVITHRPIDNVPDGCINIHAHLHQRVMKTGRHINVCVEHTGYAPVEEHYLPVLLRQQLRETKAA